MLCIDCDRRITLPGFFPIRFQPAFEELFCNIVISFAGSWVYLLLFGLAYVDYAFIGAIYISR